MEQLVQSRIELERDGGFFLVDAIGIAHYYVESSYGEDADGNRGVKSTIVDEVREIVVFGAFDVNKVELTAFEEDYVADQLTRKFLEG